MANYVSKHPGSKIDEAVDAFLAAKGVSYVKTVNGAAPDENGNVNVEVGSDVSIDATLTQEGAAADAKETGERLSQLSEEMGKKQPSGNYVKTVNGAAPDANGNVVVAVDTSLTQSGAAADAKVVGNKVKELADEIEELKKGDSGSGGSSGGTYEDTEALEFDSYLAITSNWSAGIITKTETETEYTLRRENTLSGGRLYIDWDTRKVNGFAVLAYMRDASGDITHVFSQSTKNSADGTGASSPYYGNIIGDLGGDAWLKYTGVKSDFHWGVKGPFSVPVPEGCTVQFIIRTTDSNEEVFPDGTLNAITVRSWVNTGVKATVVVGETVTASSAIVSRNKDVSPLVQAAARYGFSENGKYNVAKQLTMLATTDLHKAAARYLAALNYMDAIEQIDFGICLGDMMGSHFSDNDGAWFTDNVNSARKKFYPIIGNHDAGNTNSTTTSATKQQQFDKFFAPVLAKLGLDGITTTYYSVNTDYGVTLIALDCHDVPDTLSDDTTFTVNRKVIGYSQAQVDWLISTLAAVPTDNHVIVAVHNMLDPATMVEGAWTQAGHMNYSHGNSTGDYPDMIPEIIDAWQNGTTLSKTYAPTKTDGMPTLTVNADFASRGAGVFAGYLRGHSHGDYIGKMTNFETQNIYCFSATADGNYQNSNSDLPRVPDDRSEDCITVVAVDKVSRKVKLVRIGSNITFDMVRRDMIAIPY